MPAMTVLAIHGSELLLRAVATLAGRAWRAIKLAAERFKNRHEAMRLADLDDRMLADIGLNRSDLRDAYAELPWRDPSDMLARRAAERRLSRRIEVRRPHAMAASDPPRARPAEWPTRHSA